MNLKKSFSKISSLENRQHDYVKMGTWVVFALTDSFVLSMNLFRCNYHKQFAKLPQDHVFPVFCRLYVYFYADYYDAGQPFPECQKVFFKDLFQSFENVCDYRKFFIIMQNNNFRKKYSITFSTLIFTILMYLSLKWFS